MSQRDLDLGGGGRVSIDVSKFVRFEAVEEGNSWFVSSGRSRHGEIGKCVGIISLLHSPGYEVVLLFSDGKLETFTAHSLFPAGGDA